MTSSASSQDTGKLVLRLTLGGLLMFHGVHKVLHGVQGIRGLLVSHHLPGAMVHGTWLGEIVAPALVILGVATRYAAAYMALFMVMAVGLAHTSQLTRTNPATGGYALELQGVCFPLLRESAKLGRREAVGGS